MDKNRRWYVNMEGTIDTELGWRICATRVTVSAKVNAARVRVKVNATKVTVSAKVNAARVSAKVNAARVIEAKEHAARTKENAVNR